MKTFYTALCVFSLLCLIIICNVFFIAQTEETLSHMLYTLPCCKEAKESLDTLNTFWQKRRIAASLSVSFDAIKEMDDRLTELYSALQNGEEKEFEKARALALNAAERLSRLERFSLENII